MPRRQDDDSLIGASTSIPPLFNEPAVCRWLGVSRSHLDRLLAEGLPYLEVGFPKPGQRTRHERRFLPRQVIQFLCRRSGDK